MSKKFDLGSVIGTVQKGIKDEKNRRSVNLGSNLKGPSKNPEDYVVLPPEINWERATSLMGLPFGKLTQIAGDSDTGKTSFAITAMKAAQAQDTAVLYVETEGKTSPQDLLSWGVDPDQVMLVQSGVAEEAFTMMFSIWDAFFDKYPKGKLLVIIDSWGNTISLRDSEIDLTEDNQKPGGNAKTNRLSVNKMIAKMQSDNAALLVVNYTYDNMGSVGKTNAGGKAIHFFTYVGFQTTRVSWIQKTVKGEKVRVGARVRWTTYKNHAAKNLESGIPHHVDFDITKDGMKQVIEDGDDE